MFTSYYRLQRCRKARALPTFRARYRALRAECDFGVWSAVYYSL